MLGVQAPGLRCASRLGRDPSLRRNQHRRHDHPDFFSGVFQILDLRACLLANHDEAPDLVDASGNFRPKTLPLCFRKPQDPFQIDAKLDFGGHLVDVLAARTARARCVDRNGGFGDDDSLRDDDGIHD